MPIFRPISPVYFGPSSAGTPWKQLVHYKICTLQEQLTEHFTFSTALDVLILNNTHCMPHTALHSAQCTLHIEHTTPTHSIIHISQYTLHLKPKIKHGELHTGLQKGGNGGNVFPANLKFLAAILADDSHTFFCKINFSLFCVKLLPSKMAVRPKLLSS